MRILIATDTYHPDVNGAAYFTYRLAVMLKAQGNEVFVAAPSKSLKKTIVNEEGVTVYGVPSVVIPIYRDYRIPPLFFVKKSIRKIVEETRPDIIHIQNHFVIGREILEVAQELDAPIMGTNHFMPDNLVHYLHLPSGVETVLKKIGWRDFLHVYNQLDLVAAPTKTAATMIENLGIKQEVIPVSCGIDLGQFNPSNDGSYLKKRYNIPDRLTLLYVGRLEEEKRVDTLVRAMPEVIKKSDAQLVLAGTGKQRHALEALAKKLGVQESIIFTGFVPDDDLKNIYPVADVFVISGLAELQSIVTMEAMASGLPVVAVDAMALPELVRDGINGFLFQNGDHEYLAKKVNQILADGKLAERMSRQSLRIIKGHDIGNTVRKYEELYHETIARHRKKTESEQGLKQNKASTWMHGGKNVLMIALLMIGISGSAMSVNHLIYPQSIFFDRLEHKVTSDKDYQNIKGKIEAAWNSVDDD
ncbi:MAG: glycosyltransferase [Actinomycetota bacterium]|nr:glycosyltransferase [Actinomycetota bacterium]MCL6093723.1 glycosyltransferase [Actinomycetota bacterium]MDA8167883.1 glycosyltransferase [Actinomycetota bacterium]